MTSSRRFQTLLRLTRAFCSLTLFAALAACASVPDDAPVVEKLDAETGVTITRLGHPVELYRETASRSSTDRFAFLGPFETNQMGSRESFLWIAVPVDVTPDSAAPVINVNGQVLPLAAPGREAQFVGLRKSPYKIPTPWAAMYYYKIDPAIVAQLGAAESLDIHVEEVTRTGKVDAEFKLSVGSDSRLRNYATR